VYICIAYLVCCSVGIGLQTTGLQIGGQKPVTTVGGGLQLGQNPSLLLGTQQGQAKQQPTGLTTGGLQLGQQSSTATQGLGLQLGNPTTSASTGIQLGGTSGVPTLTLQTGTTGKTGQTGFQLGGLGQQQKAPSSITTTQPQKTIGISLTGGISLGSSTTGIGTTGLSIGKPPPSYTAPSSTGASTVIPATSISTSVPTGSKKYTYKQLEKMINDVRVY